MTKQQGGSNEGRREIVEKQDRVKPWPDPLEESSGEHGQDQGQTSQGGQEQDQSND